jgi:hypothetical protein
MECPNAGPSPVRSPMKTRLCALLLIAAAAVIIVPHVRAQADGSAPGSNSSPAVNPAIRSEDHFTWVEQFDGSSNTEGQVMLLDSSVGYLFGRHLLVDAGVPVYFVRASTTAASGASATDSFADLGDVYGQVWLSFPNPALNFKTQLTGRAPTGSTSNGISTGHATYDWTNRIDRDFGPWTPFLELGLANSIPDTFVYRRPFASYGELGHFQAGAAYHVADWLSVAASAFDVAPWGSQTIDSRVGGNGSGATRQALRFCKATRPRAVRAWRRTTDLAPAWVFRLTRPSISRSATAEAAIMISIQFLLASP